MTGTRSGASGARAIAQRYDRVVRGLERLPLAVLQLGFRFAVGLVFFNSGLLKLNSWQFAVLLFRDEYKVPLLSPEIAAAIATSFELACPAFLFVGFATRLATLPLFGMIVVIQLFVYPQAWPEHLMWSSILGFLLTRGAGTISLDAILARRLAVRSA